MDFILRILINQVISQDKKKQLINLLYITKKKINPNIKTHAAY